MSEAVRAALAAAWETCRLPADWEWDVRESTRARRVGFDVDKYGTLTVTVPSGAGPERVAAAIRENTRWIIHHVAERRKNRPVYKVAELVNGEGFRWEGYNARLDRVSQDDPRPGVRKNTGNIILAGTPWNGQPWFDRDGYGRWLRLPAELGQGREAADAIIRLYTTAGADLATERVHEHGPYSRLSRMGLAGNPPAITAGNTGADWVGYHARTHTVTLHWAVFQFDLTVIDYLTAQGLVWATRPGGSKYGPEFRRRLTSIVHLIEPLERQLTEQAQRPMWMGDVE